MQAVQQVSCTHAACHHRHNRLPMCSWLNQYSTRVLRIPSALHPGHTALHGPMQGCTRRFPAARFPPAPPALPLAARPKPRPNAAWKPPLGLYCPLPGTCCSMVSTRGGSRPRRPSRSRSTSGCAVPCAKHISAAVGKKSCCWAMPRLSTCTRVAITAGLGAWCHRLCRNVRCMRTWVLGLFNSPC